MSNSPDIVNGIQMLKRSWDEGGVAAPPSPKQTLDSKIHEAIEEFEMATGGVVTGLMIDLDHCVVLEVA